MFFGASHCTLVESMGQSYPCSLVGHPILAKSPTNYIPSIFAKFTPAKIYVQ